MQKVLIISYFFPPCNLTASQRAYSWAQQLHQFGFYPIVLTRRWDNKINKLADVSIATQTEVVIEKNQYYEVHYLPYYSNLRDKIYLKYGDAKFTFIRRLLTFLELLIQPVTNFVIPYKNIFDYADVLCASDSTIKKAVITGNPFNFYKLGYNLQKKHSVNWIADYRDAWTTSEINAIGRSCIFKIVNFWEAFFEKKWVSTASIITASSQPIADSIHAFVHKPAHALFNGFVSSDFNKINHLSKFGEFTVTYVGTLYDGQKIEIFCDALKQFIDSQQQPQIKFLLPGLAFYERQQERIISIMRGYEGYFECTPRMERNRILEIEKQSHLLLHVAWDEQKGIIASKIYEYLASGTKILVVPSDKGSIQEIVLSSETGNCFSTTEETFLFLKEKYERFKMNIVEINDTSTSKVLQYSRERQTQKLADLITSI